MAIIKTCRYSLCMKRLLSILVLCGAAYADVPFGEYITKGSVTFFCFRVPVSMLASIGAPALPGHNGEELQAFVKTTDPQTDAFEVTITYRPGNSNKDVTQVRYATRYRPVGDTPEYQSGVSISTTPSSKIISVKVKELRLNTEQEF